MPLNYTGNHSISLLFSYVDDFYGLHDLRIIFRITSIYLHNTTPFKQITVVVFFFSKTTKINNIFGKLSNQLCHFQFLPNKSELNVSMLLSF